MGQNLPLLPTGKVIGKTCPFQEIPVKRKAELEIWRYRKSELTS